MDIVVGAITTVVKYLVSPFMDHVCYIVHYKGNANDLRKQMASLGELKADVQRSVDSASMRGEVIKVAVEGWLTKVNQKQSEETALQNAMEEGKGCLQGGCFVRYQVGRDAKRMIDEAKELLNEGRTFATVSDPSPLPPSPESMPTLDFQVYDSTKLAIDQIMKALEDKDITMVGVYGIGGVGKTTLMKEVAKKVKTNGLFNQVVMVTVSQHPELMKTQGEIAENLGLKLEEKYSLDVRARRILERLNKEKRILIVLDDLWEPLDLLKQVGIPCGNSCKVVLTTRKLDVCTQMKTQFDVEVKILSREDAWVLFKRAAGDHIEDDGTLRPLAEQIVGECGGLPLAIVTIGSALRGKDLSEWEDAASQLNKSGSLPPDIEGVHEKVFCSIKLSYDSLASDATRFCFLLCCMFPEDFSISEDDLLPYVVGEGVFGSIHTLREARNRLHTQMKRLERSCLLIEDSGRKVGCVKMHDIIRDVSIWIASKESHDAFVVESGRQLKNWPDGETLKKCKRLSLMRSNITKLPDRLDCSQLITLSLRGNWNLKEIPDGFFQGMISLKTLDLERTSIFSIPSSLSCLTDLRVLRIRRYDFVQPLTISLIGKLRKLEILHLPFCNVEKMQEEIGELTNLKSLNLSGNRGLTIAPNTLSRLSVLEELNLEDSFHRWDMEGSAEEDGGISEVACLSDVASLSSLTTLNIMVSNMKCLCVNIPCRWENLTSFSVSFEMFGRRSDNYVSKCTSWVYIEGASLTPLADWVRIYLLERAKGLQFSKCHGFKDVLSLGPRGLNNLQILRVEECEDMEYLLNTSADESELEGSQIAFSSLELLCLLALPELKAVCHGSLPSGGCFNNLRFLWMSHCLKLVSIIPSDLLEKLPNLEELEVCACVGSTEVFNSKGLLDKRQATMTKLKRLDLRSLTVKTVWEGIVSPLSFLNLEEICVGLLVELKFMFSLAMAQRLQQLKQLDIRWCEKMEQIISMEGDEIYTRGSPSSAPQLNSSSPSILPAQIFGNLRLLRIRHCDSLKHILPMSLSRCLLQLEELDIRKCPNLEEIFVNDHDTEEEKANGKIVFPRLRYLELRSLPNLSMMSKGVLPNHNYYWPSLETLKVWRCPILKRLPVSLGTATKLREITVEEEWFNRLEFDDKLQLQERVKVKFNYEDAYVDEDEDYDEYAFDCWAFGRLHAEEFSPPTYRFYNQL